MVAVMIHIHKVATVAVMIHTHKAATVAVMTHTQIHIHKAVMTHDGTTHTHDRAYKSIPITISRET